MFTFSLLPFAVVLTLVGLLGLIIGSFLNVYIYRFHTGKSLAGHSHCLSCARRLRWYELLPVVSYLALRGRCRTCGSTVPSRYLLVESATATLFLLVALTVTDWLLWSLFFWLVSVLLVITVYDIYHMIIPNSLVVTLCVMVFLWWGYQWFVLDASGQTLAWSGGAAVLAFSFFASLWWYSGGRWIGFGDAKLAVPLGALVGVSGVFSMIVLAFWIGTLVSLGLLGWQHWRVRGQAHLRFVPTPLTMKSEVPFAPFLIAGFVVVFFLGVDVLELVTYVLY